MPRNPNDPNSRSSAEWPAPPAYVTQEQFSGFMAEFRTRSDHADEKLDLITQRIAKGDTKFELLQRDAAECKTKQGEHSTLIKALTTKDAIREATAAAQSPQMGVVANAAITAAVTVVVGGVLGFAYKIFVLDIKQEAKQELKQEEKADGHPVTHPAHVP